MTSTHRVSLVKATDRSVGIRNALDLLGGFEQTVSGKQVVLKPNFNSADPFPAATHNSTAEELIRTLQKAGASDITVAERSGIAWNSHEVAEQKGLGELFSALGVTHVILDDLSSDEWVTVPLEGGHWARGIEIPRLVLDAEVVVMTCCLKTHAYGGHFTMSLKNGVGLVPLKSLTDDYDFMGELHSSPHQRAMIAEINTAFRTDLVLLDAMSAFITGGPFEGDVVHPGMILASTDRVAIDAVGVAILRMYETTEEVRRGAVFEQDQLRRAAELGLGARSAKDIELVAADDAVSQEALRSIRRILEQN